MTLSGAIMELVMMRENPMMPVVFKSSLDKVIESVSECEEPSPNCSEIPNNWIPCEKKLPEFGEDVLTQLANDDMIVNWVVDEDDREWFYDDVVAWQPLPAPYQQKEDES